MKKHFIMKKHFMLLSLTLSALLLAPAGRAAAETSPNLSSPAPRNHFPVYVSDVTWNPGCGIEGACRSGLFMNYRLMLFDLKLYYVEDIDNAAQTITIIVDSWSYAPSHPLPGEDQTIELPSDELELFTDYAVEVLDYQHRPIWTGSIRTDLAK